MSAANLNTAFDLAELFNQVHGYKPAYVAGLPAASAAGPAVVVPSTLKKITNIYGQPLYGQADMMGHEVFCPIVIEGVKNGKVKSYNYPYAVIGIDRIKTIVETQMTEINGTVKEIISNGDYQITIKGFLLGQYEQFPDKELTDLRELFDQNQSVRLQSAFSDLFLHGNDRVVLTKLSVPEKPKVIGVRDFSLTAVSDIVFTLYQL
jgi:hypothetical protein